MDLDPPSDVRFLQNPNYAAELENQTGDDPAVGAFIEDDPALGAVSRQGRRPARSPSSAATLPKGRRSLPSASAAPAAAIASIYVARRLLARYAADVRFAATIEQRDARKSSYEHVT